jgi:hypothetical protein
MLYLRAKAGMAWRLPKKTAASRAITDPVLRIFFMVGSPFSSAVNRRS